MIKFFNKLVDSMGMKVIKFDIIPSEDYNEIIERKCFYIGWKATVEYKGKTTQYGRYWPCVKDYGKVDGIDKELVGLISHDFTATMRPILFQD